MKRLLLVPFLFTLSLLGLQAQTDYWASHNLLQSSVSEVYGIAPKTETKVFVSTDQGLGLYDLNVNQYDTILAIPQGHQATRRIFYENNIVWLETDSGVVKYDGTNLFAFGKAQGIPSDTISDLAVNSQGQLWVATPQGVAYSNGANFSLDTSLALQKIVFDTLDRLNGAEIVILSNEIPNPSLNRVWVRAANTWTQHQVTSPDSTFTVLLNQVRRMANGEIIIASRDDGYYTLHYPARLEFHPLISRDSYSQTLHGVEVDHNNRAWISESGFISIFSAKDSILEPHHITGLSNIGSNLPNIRVMGNTIMLLSRSLLFSASINVESNKVLGEEIDVNSIRTKASVLGPLFQEEATQEGVFEFPKGDSTHGMYLANIMLLTKKQNETNFEANHIKPYSGSFMVGPVSSAAGNPGSWIVKISKQEILDHQNNYSSPGYLVPENIANWKGNGDVSAGMAPQLAPYEDLNNNGAYEPNLGDYPIIKGDEAIYWINHIGDIEYHGMLYGYDRPSDSALHQSLFVSYEIFNRSGISIDSAKMGFYADFELGNPFDDFLGCDSSENVFYVYNLDAFDEDRSGRKGFGSETPFLGVKFLSDSMHGFVLPNEMLVPIADSLRAKVWLGNLTSKPFGRKLFVDSSGHLDTTGRPTNFMFHDVLYNDSSISNPLSNTTGLGHIPWFSLQPNESKTIEMVIGYARDAGGGQLGSKSKMLNYLDSAESFWASNVTTSLAENLGGDLQKQNDLLLYPNPAKDKLVVVIPKASVHGLNSQIEVFTLQGKRIFASKGVSNKNLISIDHLKSGIYIIRYKNQVKKFIKL